MNQVRLGQLLRARREDLGRTQQQIADAAGLAKSRVSQVESGDAGLPESLASITTALDARWLVHLVPADLAPERSALLEQLVGIIADLDERDVKHLSGMMRLYDDELRERRANGLSKT